MSADSHQHDQTDRQTLGMLRDEHREALIRAINRTLSTQLAEITYAQILDGLPLADVADDTSEGAIHDGHPIFEKHKELCPGVMDRLKVFQDQFDPTNLTFEASLMHAYHSAASQSREFGIRLIELTAVALHQIAVFLYQTDQSLHKSDGIATWEPPKSDEQFWYLYPKGPPPTLFYHPWYENYEHYPNGVADMVGYWAEARILGGVVIFDRARECESDAVYLFPNRWRVSYRIFKLLPDQKKRLLDFLTSDTPLDEDVLPILSSEDNRARVDPEEPPQSVGIYRDIWERQGLPDDRDIPDRRRKDVWAHFDWPTSDDRAASVARASERKWRLEYEWLSRETSAQEEACPLDQQ